MDFDGSWITNRLTIVFLLWNCALLIWGKMQISFSRLMECLSSIYYRRLWRVPYLSLMKDEKSTVSFDSKYRYCTWKHSRSSIKYWWHKSRKRMHKTCMLLQQNDTKCHIKTYRNPFNINEISGTALFRDANGLLTVRIAWFKARIHNEFAYHRYSVTKRHRKLKGM